MLLNAEDDSTDRNDAILQLLETLSYGLCSYNNTGLGFGRSSTKHFTIQNYKRGRI